MDGLWPYHLVTILYLGFGAVVLYGRWGEVGSLFESPESGQARLPLNSIGDVLAGFFAPLAFLWLFAATQLQRKELKLQREELADTREVLDEQKSELQRAAKESNLQTNIMNQTLLATLAKNELEELSLNLYFISRKCIDYNVGAVGIMDSMGSAYKEVFGDAPNVTQVDPSTVDKVFISLHAALLSMVRKIERDQKAYISAHSASRMNELLPCVIQQLSEILTIYESSPNNLVRAKIDNLNIKAILDYSKFLLVRCSEWSNEQADRRV